MKKIICVAAIDSQRGLADSRGIPWQGKLPTDSKYYLQAIEGGMILMGYGTYVELSEPIRGCNFVASSQARQLRSGFEQVTDAREFLRNSDNDIKVIGGAGLFASIFDLVTDLDLTRVEGDFHCTKFFPEFEEAFVRMAQSEPMVENNITFQFETWQRKNLRTERFKR